MNAPIQPQIQSAHLLTADPVSAGSLVLRFSGVLVLVLMLILAIAWLARRNGWGNSLAKGKSILTVKHSYSLSQRERIVIVEADGRLLMLGVTPGSITFLTEMDNTSCDVDTPSALPGGYFQQALMKAMGKKQGTES